MGQSIYLARYRLEIDTEIHRNPMPEGQTFTEWANTEAGKHGDITFKDWAKEEAGEFYEQLSEYEYSGALGEPMNRDAATDVLDVTKTEMEEETHSMRKNPAMDASTCITFSMAAVEITRLTLEIGI